MGLIVLCYEVKAATKEEQEQEQKQVFRTALEVKNKTTPAELMEKVRGVRG